MDERDAIARLKRGDIDAIDILINKYQQKAFQTAYLITHDAALAEDVVQESFVKAYEGIAKFDNTRPFAPWFLRSVVNRAVKATKKRQRFLSLESPMTDKSNDVTFGDLLTDDNHTYQPEDALENAELREMVKDALQALTPDQRAAIVLRYYLGYSEKEMSEQMNVSPGTVKSRLSRARKQMRVLWVHFKLVQNHIER